MFLNLFKKPIPESKERYNFKKNLEKFKSLKKRKKLIIGVTVGRSGMTWVLEILKAHYKIYGGGERNSTCESFYRYSNHYKMNIDQSGLLNSIISETLNDWKKNDISFQLSPYFSHSIDLIEKELIPDGYIWGINDHMFTVQSFFNKGWYDPDYNILYNNKKPGFSLSDSIKPSHFFGRIAPSGAYHRKWLKLSRIGKISWYINYTNKIIYNSLKKINKNKKFTFILNKGDQNYNFYLKLAEWLKIKNKISLNEFLKIKYKRKTMYKKSENKKIKFSKKDLNEVKNNLKYFIKIYNYEEKLIKY